MSFLRLAFLGGNKGDFSFAHTPNRTTCGKYRAEKEKKKPKKVVRLHLTKEVKKNVTLVKPKK